MGLSFSKLVETAEKKRVLVLGLPDAGKTTLLYALITGFKFGSPQQVEQSIPYIGLILETIEYQGMKLISWDLWPNRIRLLYQPYFQETQALIFMIDCSDPKLFEIAVQEFQVLLNVEELKYCPLLILANKQDQAKITISEITDRLKLQMLQRSWFIQGTCVVKREGIFDGFDWLTNTLNTK